MKVKDSRDDLSQCGCDTCVMKDKTSNSVQACSDLAHVVLVLVGVRRVRRVTVVHIGLEEVIVVIYFCVAIFVRELLYQEMFSLQYTEPYMSLYMSFSSSWSASSPILQVYICETSLPPPLEHRLRSSASSKFLTG